MCATDVHIYQASLVTLIAVQQKDASTNHHSRKYNIEQGLLDETRCAYRAHAEAAALLDTAASMTPAGSQLLLLLLLVLPGWMLVAKAEHILEPLVKWIKEQGGQAHVKAADPVDPSKGMVASQNVPEGGRIAVLPFSTCYRLPDTGSVQVMAAEILKNAANPDDWYKPLWASGLVIRQPRKQLTAGIYSFPEQYIPLLKSPELESYIEKEQAVNRRFWEKHKAELEPLGVTFERFSQMVHIVGSRSFHYVDTSYLIPLVDLATHKVRCSHYASISGCSAPTKPPGDQQQDLELPLDASAAAAAVDSTAPDSAAAGSAGQGDPVAESPVETDVADKSSGKAEKMDIDGLCVTWFAGHDIKAGDELCTSYGVSWSDEALLMFGLVLDKEVDAYHEPDLAASDTRLFDVKKPWTFHEDMLLEGSEADMEALIAEKKRLLSRLKLLEASKHAVAAANAVPEDTDGQLLVAIRKWREVRAEGLKSESLRVDQAIELHWLGEDDEDDGEVAEPPAFISAGSKKEKAAKESSLRTEL